MLAHDDAAMLFAMEYLDPADHRLWKSELMAGRVDLVFAAAVGARLAAIHGATAGDTTVAAMFPTGAFFEALRLEPYLRATGRRHPDLAGTLEGLADRTAAPNGPSSMATSAPRTSCSARTARCSSMPNAPGMATRPSTSPSASTTCFSNALPHLPRRRSF